MSISPDPDRPKHRFGSPATDLRHFQEVSPVGRNSSLVVLGSVAFDRLERGSRIDFRLGGVGTYAGLTAHQLGWNVRLLAHLPEADLSLLAPLDRMGPNCWLPSANRTVFVNREWGVEPTDKTLADQAEERQNVSVSRQLPGDAASREQFLLSKSDTLLGAELDKWLPVGSMVDWVHLGPLFPEDMAPEVIPIARSRAKVLTADLQGWVRGVGQDGRVVASWSAEREAFFIGLDWVKASESEWEVVQSHSGLSPEAALKKYGWKGLLLTAGHRGGRLFLPRETLSWKAVSPLHIVQETGAGDVFMAAFIAFLLGLDQPQQGSPQHALDGAARLVSRHLSGNWLDADALRLPAMQ